MGTRSRCAPLRSKRDPVSRSAGHTLTASALQARNSPHGRQAALRHTGQLREYHVTGGGD